MPVYCGNCGTQKGLPFSSMRTARAPCDYCGGFDTYKVRDRRNNVVDKEMPNYSYPDSLLASATQEEAQANE